MSTHVIQEVKWDLIMSKAEDSILVMKMVMLGAVQNCLNSFAVNEKQNVAFICKVAPCIS